MRDITTYLCRPLSSFCFDFFFAARKFKAMRAVLDRPHRSNFVSVSTAVNRVAKLTAARRRGGGLKGEEEPKYLGVLLKVGVCFCAAISTKSQAWCRGRCILVGNCRQSAAVRASTLLPTRASFSRRSIKSSSKTNPKPSTNSEKQACSMHDQLLRFSRS